MLHYAMSYHNTKEKSFQLRSNYRDSESFYNYRGHSIILKMETLKSIITYKQVA